MPSRPAVTRPRGSVTSGVITAAVETAAYFLWRSAFWYLYVGAEFAEFIICACEYSDLSTSIQWIQRAGYREQDTESRIQRAGYIEQDTQKTSAHIYQITWRHYTNTWYILEFWGFSHLISTFLQTSRSLCSGTQNNIPEERSHFPVWSIISDMFVPVLCLQWGNHSCAAWAVVNGQLPKNVSLFIWILFILFLWRCDPRWVMASSFLRFLDHTQRRTTVARTPLDEWSARRQRLLPDNTQHSQNTHNRQTYMPPVRFEPTISAGERPQTYALDRAATGTGIYNNRLYEILTH